jgi:uncharacterized membrane protein YfcA
MVSYLLLICAAFSAGLINSVAGGGSFLTFPALVFTGVPSIIANATSTVSLLPGTLASAWAYREDFKSFHNSFQGFPFWPMLAVSVGGGMAGALLLLHTPQETFDDIIPWLLLAATLMFALGPRVSPLLKRMFHIGPLTLICVQLAAAVYAGYFGGAIGILMLSAWSLYGITDIHAMNANKTLLGSSMNSIAVVLFVMARKIWWTQGLVMLVAAVIGGYTGARAAKRFNPRHVRIAVILISSAITVAFFLRQH